MPAARMRSCRLSRVAGSPSERDLSSRREPDTASIAMRQSRSVSAEILAERLNEPKVSGASAAGGVGSGAFFGGM